MKSVLVFDTTALSHFSRAGRVDVLEKLVVGRRCVMPAEVRAEVAAGIAKHPIFRSVLVAPWIEAVELVAIEELAAFARFKSELGGGIDRNNGEAAVLAWTSIHGGAAIIDERAGSRIAKREGMEVHGSLWLIVDGYRTGVLGRQESDDLVDDLRYAGMHLPTDGSGLFDWAEREGLLP